MPEQHQQQPKSGGRGKRLSTAAAVYKFYPIVERKREERGLSYYLPPFLSTIGVSFDVSGRLMEISGDTSRTYY